jgi:hypothetical protein
MNQFRSISSFTTVYNLRFNVGLSPKHDVCLHVEQQTTEG